MKITKPHRPTTPERLAAFEAQIGFRLPDQYRDFLLAHNGGGHPKPSIYEFDQDGFANGSDVNWFYGIEADYPYDLVAIWKMDTIPPPYLPENLFAIGSDSGANSICIVVQGDNRGQIYFYDKNMNSTHWLADSFSEFIDNLLD